MNNIINNWKVNYNNIKKGKYTLIECQCINCGNIKFIRKDQLLRNVKVKCELCEKIYLESFINRVYDRLTIISYEYKGSNNYHYFKCRCDCGNIKTICLRDLLNGDTKSCGCLYNEKIKTINTTHGLSNHRLYNIYYNMIGRCYHQNNNDYNNYGGRGIYICDEWLGENGFIKFYNWSINNGYHDELSIDRLDVNGPYAPWNCRWATNIQQSNNKSDTLYISLNNINYTISELSFIYNISYHDLYRKLIINNMSIYDIIKDRKMNPIRFV